ncbi:MAG: ion transporter, partial [Alphaproteobacteria bacterium]
AQADREATRDSYATILAELRALRREVEQLRKSGG